MIGAQRQREEAVSLYTYDVTEVRDGLLRRLAGRLWVDQTEKAVAQVEVRNTSSVRFALGLGATVSSLSLHARFRRLEEGAWLPRSLAISAEGKKLLFKGFRLRTTTTYDHYPFRPPGRLRGEPVSVPSPFPFPFLYPPFRSPVPAPPIGPLRVLPLCVCHG